MVSSIYLNHSGTEDLRDFILAVAAVELFMILFFLECKVYDLSTALFFSVSLGLLQRCRFKEYYLLFPVACLNRETMFLLIIFFMFYFYKRLEISDWVAGVMYQSCVFMMIRLYLMALYADSPGVPFLFRVVENFADYVKYPWRSLLFFIAVMVIVWMCMRNWHDKPLLLRTAFVVFAPVLMVLYFLFGSAFEIRVFAEMWPVVVVLVIDPHHFDRLNAAPALPQMPCGTFRGG